MDSYENGIAERRIADDTIDTSYMAVEVQKALEDAGVSGEDIDLYFSGDSNTRSCVSSSSLCHSRSDWSETCGTMDVGATCAGFMYGMITARQFIQTGTYKNVLVVGSDKLSKIVDWNDEIQRYYLETEPVLS